MESGEADASESPVLAKEEAGERLAVSTSEHHGDGLSNDESWLADTDEEADGASYLEREWAKRHEQFYNTGYRDGISAGRNDAAQDGFNYGFKDSVLVGYKWGIVRGVTSALAHLPNELKVKLLETDEIRGQFMDLHVAVDSIGKVDALKLFNDDIKRAISAEQSKSIETGSSSTHESSSEHSSLENYFEKLELLLQQSPAVDVQLKSEEERVS